MASNDEGLEKSLKILRDNPAFHTLIADLRDQREENIRRLRGEAETNLIHELVGTITTLQEIADTFEGV